MIRRIWKNKWVRTGAVLAVFLAYCILTTVFLGSACPLYLVTGLPCPACGMTRAWLALVTLHPAEAFTLQPLFPLAAFALFEVVLVVARPQFARKKWLSAVNLALVAAFLVAYVTRMALFFPHTAPMQYNRESLLYLIIRAVRGN